ncbi:hypothetical protein DFH07DRAFT_738212, partial [Mycena maculata]
QWEEMWFHQRRHEQEWLLNFLQRHELYYVFLYPDKEDGVNVVNRLLQTAPDVWAGTINSERYPDIFSLMVAIQRYCATLKGNWTMAQRLGNLNNYYPCRSNRNAHTADHEEMSSTDETEQEDAEPSPAIEVTNKDVASSSHQDWPQGKTVKGYEFVKRDNVHSNRAPANGVCYICSSANHFAWDCPHYEKWLSLRDANMLQVDVAFDIEEKDLHKYIAMCAEVYNANSSSYLKEPLKKCDGLEVVPGMDA